MRQILFAILHPNIYRMEKRADYYMGMQIALDIHRDDKPYLQGYYPCILFKI